MAGNQTRRRYLQMLGVIGTIGIAGCSGNETADEATTTTAPETTNTPTPTTENTTTQKEPDFHVTIEAPDTVTNTETWEYSIKVVNQGGPGKFSSPVSSKINDGEWELMDTVTTEVLENQEQTTIEVDDISAPAALELHLRVDDPGVTKTVQVEWAEKYKRSNIRDNATSPAYDEFFRNFEAFQGEQIHFLYGDVYQTLYDQADSPPQYDYYQIYVTNNEQEYEGDIAADWYGDERLIEEDIIELWGVAENLYSYETVEGDTRTIPRITLVDYELREEQ